MKIRNSIGWIIGNDRDGRDLISTTPKECRYRFFNGALRAHINRHHLTH